MSLDATENKDAVGSGQFLAPGVSTSTSWKCFWTNNCCEHLVLALHLRVVSATTGLLYLYLVSSSSQGNTSLLSPAEGHTILAHLCLVSCW